VTLLAHLPVYECVDDLCKKAASLWAGRKMLGIVAAAHAQLGTFTWDNPFTSCAKKAKPRLST
jgi:hypothetical protein